MAKENGVGDDALDDKESSQLYQSIRGGESSLSSQHKDKFHLKILVPSIAAGAIIGKGGKAITNIQNETLCKVKMSKSNAFYPGTTERVCLIIGSVDSLLRVFHYISQKIYEKPVFTQTGCENRRHFERHKQVKILVPNSTAGMIIGKGGSFIKELKESLGVFIQVSQKSMELNLSERCVTVAGELSQTRKAVALILTKIVEDPQSSNCPIICYSDMTGPVASAYPTGSPYALALNPSCPLDMNQDATAAAIAASQFRLSNNRQLGLYGPSSSNPNTNSLFVSSSSPALAVAMAAICAMTPPNLTSSSVAVASCASAFDPNMGGRALLGRGVSTSGLPPHSLLGPVGSQLAIDSPLRSSSPHLDRIQQALKLAGYADSAVEEIANAMQVLHVYGFLSSTSLSTANPIAAMLQPIRSFAGIESYSHRSVPDSHSLRSQHPHSRSHHDVIRPTSTTTTNGQTPIGTNEVCPSPIGNNHTVNGSPPPPPLPPIHHTTTTTTTTTTSGVCSATVVDDELFCSFASHAAFASNKFILSPSDCRYLHDTSIYSDSDDGNDNMTLMTSTAAAVGGADPSLLHYAHSNSSHMHRRPMIMDKPQDDGADEQV